MYAGIIILLTTYFAFVLSLLSCPMPCNTQSDCKPNECCINNVKPIGRRSVDQYAGHCLQLGVECYVRYCSASLPPDNLIFGCPCTIPLICKGNGTYDMPLGKLGYCKHK